MVGTSVHAAGSIVAFMLDGLSANRTLDFGRHVEPSLGHAVADVSYADFLRVVALAGAQDADAQSVARLQQFSVRKDTSSCIRLKFGL